MSLVATNETPSADKWNQKLNFIGATAPTSTFAGQIWIDTTTDPPKVKVRNSANTAFDEVERQANKNVASGYAGLDASTLVFTSQIPEAAKAKPLLWVNEAGSSIAANVTTNMPLMGAGFISAEANSQCMIPRAGTIKNLRVRVTANTVTATTTVKLRVNGADTALSVSIGGGAIAIFADTTNSISVTQDSLVNWQMVVGATGTSILVLQISGEFVS